MATHHVSIDQFARILSNLDQKTEKAVVRGLRSTGMRMVGIVVKEIDNAEPFPAVDRGELRNSVRYEPTERGCIVTVTAPHAAIIEYGTRPFRPPLEPLVRWVLRKGLANPKKRARKMRPKKPKKPRVVKKTTTKTKTKSKDKTKGKRMTRNERAAKRLAVVKARDEEKFGKRTDDELAAAKRIARAIQSKIARDGIKPRMYFRKAIGRLRHDRILEKEVRRELDRAARKK
jgi:hypothetical protein